MKGEKAHELAPVLQTQQISWRSSRVLKYVWYNFYFTVFWWKYACDTSQG